LLRVASYNIRKSIGRDRRRRPERILAVLAEIGADIVVLQEADRRFGRRVSSLPPARLASESGYRALDLAVRPDSIGWHGNAILVRESVTAEECGRLPLPHLEARGAVQAVFAAGSGRFRVIGTHLSLLQSWRHQQSEALVHHLLAQEALPTLLIGDLNDWSHHGASLAPLEKLLAGRVPGLSYPTFRPRAPLDRFYSSAGLRILACGVHETPLARIASDHLPVWVDLELEDGELATPWRRESDS
jgi:endonuclease/exonuclease/phosphatase family metal-dependent hydrolase